MVALHTEQSLLGLPGGVTVLDVTVRDVYAAQTVAEPITAVTGVQADSWIKTNEQFFTTVSAQTKANTAIRFFVALSVAFGIASVLLVSVVQKSREIGILRAIGIARGQIVPKGAKQPKRAAPTPPRSPKPPPECRQPRRRQSDRIACPAAHRPR